MPLTSSTTGSRKEKILVVGFLLTFLLLILAKESFFPAALLPPDRTQQIQDIYGNSVVSRVSLGYGDSVSIETGIHYLVHCPTDDPPANYGFHSVLDFDALGLHIYEYTTQQSDERDKAKTGKARWNGRTFGYDVNDDLDLLQKGGVYLVSAAAPFEFSCAGSGLGGGSSSSSSAESSSSSSAISCAANQDACANTGLACNTFTGICVQPCTGQGNVCATGESCDTNPLSATSGRCVRDCTISGVDCPVGTSCNSLTKLCDPVIGSSSSSSAANIACIVVAASGNSQLMGPTCPSFTCASGFSPICLGPTNANCSIPCTRVSPTSPWNCRPECPLTQVRAMCIDTANPSAPPQPGSCNATAFSSSTSSTSSTVGFQCPPPSTITIATCNPPPCISPPAGCHYENEVRCPSTTIPSGCIFSCGNLVDGNGNSC